MVLKENASLDFTLRNPLIITNSSNTRTGISLSIISIRRIYIRVTSIMKVSIMMNISIKTIMEIKQSTLNIKVNMINIKENTIKVNTINIKLSTINISSIKVSISIKLIKTAIIIKNTRVISITNKESFSITEITRRRRNSPSTSRYRSLTIITVPCRVGGTDHHSPLPCRSLIT